MGQIFSKCLGSRKKRGKQPVSATTAPSGVATPPILPPSGTATVPNEAIPPPAGETSRPNETSTPPNEPVLPSSKAPAVPNEQVLPPSEASVAPNKTTVPPSQITAPPAKEITPSSGKRNFWKEAVEMLPQGCGLPEEWRTATIDGRDVVEEVKSKMEECKDKRWKININGKEVVVRDVFEKTLGWVQKCMVVGDTAIQYAPSNASLPWRGFRFLVQLAVKETETYGAMLAGLERATWLTFYCSAQERLYKDYFADNDKYSDLNNTFIEDLVDSYKAILTFLIQAHEYYTKGDAARIAGAAITLGSWVRELTQTIDDRKLRMEDYASLVHKSNVHQDLKSVLGMLEPFSEYMSEEATRRKEKERQEFMKWLSDIDYRKDHEANSCNILENSGYWMLESEEFRSWKEGGSLLWLRGIPGAGKTKLTSTIINHLMKTDENHTIAYFYCMRDTKQPKKEDPEEILRAILKQLITLLPNRLSNPVKAKYEMEKQEGSDHGLIRSLTLEECAHFLVELATNRPFTIIIDALDECRENRFYSSQGGHTDRRDLVVRLEEMINIKSGNVKVFLSSRDDQDIWYQLKTYPTITLNASRNGADIRSFVESEVDDLMMKKSHWEDDKTLKEEIIVAVSDRAGGMFRFAALQIDYLGGLKTRDSVRKRLRNLPTTLREIYDEIYGRILAMEEDDEQSIAKSALSWLLCARRQLSSSELLAAVSPNPGDWVNVDELLNLCRHLVVLNEVSDSFELAHVTVREYLETSEEYMDGQPHALVAEGCIKLFEPKVPRGVLDQYASLYWVDHYNSRPQTGEDAVTDVVKKLFRNKGMNPAFETWAKLARDSAEALSWGDNLRRMLQDANYRPLSVICVFGFPKLLDQWMDTIPGYSFFRDSDDMVVHLAIKWGNEEVVRLLLRPDDQPAIDQSGWTSTFWAAIYERLPVLEVLKELHGDMDAEDEMGWIALDWMVILGRLEGLKVLLRLEAGENMTNEDKWTPLHWAALLDREAETKELVAYDRADGEDFDGFTPLQWAKYLGHEATAQHLRTNEAGGSFGSNLRVSPGVKTVRMDWELSSSNTALMGLEI